MAPGVLARSVSIRWNCVAVVSALAWLAVSSVSAQQANARYVGGTLAQQPPVTQYKCPSTRGTLDTTSDSELRFDGGKKALVVIPYRAISSLQYGVDADARGAFCYPWDSYVQFTKKRHYVLTVVFQDARDQEQAAVFEVDPPAVRSTLAALEARSGKQVAFTEAIACTEYKTAEDCGRGQPGELKGLSRVFIDTDSVSRDRIASEIAASQLGLTLVNGAEGAEIILRFTSGIVSETGGSFAANGGKPMSAGRGEVHVLREGRSRVVLFFEGMRMSGLQKEPATKFGRTFVEAFTKAKTPGQQATLASLPWRWS